jgi:hypothetical protein
MNTGYLIYQAERPLSRAEQQRVDIAQAELVRKVGRGWHALTAPLRALRSTGRPAGRQPAHRATEYPAAECLTGCQEAECLTGCQEAECLTGCQEAECLTGRVA